jgi:tetratricopeptide (TPR) repeat protein
MRRSSSLQWLCVLAAIALPGAFAEGRGLDGQVRDSRTHARLPFVRVELMYRTTQIDLQYSDEEGDFHFAKLEPGRYTISAALSGYQAAVVSVDTTTQSRIDLELTHMTAPIQPVPPVASLREYLVPNAARKAFDRARKEIERQDCVKAIEHLEKGLHLYPQDAAALNDLGNCHRKLGDLQSAEAAFKRAMTLSDGVFILMNLAETYTAQQRFSEAEAILTEAIRKTPDSGDLYYALAVVYFKQDRLEDAEAAALQADSRKHRIPDLHLLLAKIYLKINTGKVALQLALYLKEAPDGPQSKRVREVLKAAKQG